MREINKHCRLTWFAHICGRRVCRQAVRMNAYIFRLECTEHLNFCSTYVYDAIQCLMVYSSLFHSFIGQPSPCTQTHIRGFHLRYIYNAIIKQNFLSHTQLSAIIAHKTIRSRRFSTLQKRKKGKVIQKKKVIQFVVPSRVNTQFRFNCRIF